MTVHPEQLNGARTTQAMALDNLKRDLMYGMRFPLHTFFFAFIISDHLCNSTVWSLSEFQITKA